MANLLDTNRKKVEVLRMGDNPQYEQIHSGKLKPGDIVKITEDMEFPADMVLLSKSPHSQSVQMSQATVSFRPVRWTVRKH